MHMHMYTYIFTYTAICIYLCIYIYIYNYMSMYVYIYIYIHTYIYIYIYVIIYLHMYTVYIHTYVYIYTYVIIYGTYTVLCWINEHDANFWVKMLKHIVPTGWSHQPDCCRMLSLGTSSSARRCGTSGYTLWWTNIAIENGHRNSGFSH